MSRTRLRLLALATAAATLGANLSCKAPETAAVTGVLVRDSAGVQIVEHSAEVMASLPQLVMDTVPVVRVGEDTTVGVFSDVQNGVRLRDGRFVLREYRGAEARLFSDKGIFERVIARRGSGPGELAGVGSVQLMPNDSVMVFDNNQFRAMMFGPDGKYARQINYPKLSGGVRARVASVLPDSRILALLYPPRELTATTGPVMRPPFFVAFIREHQSSDVVPDSSMRYQIDTLGKFPDYEQYPIEFKDGADKANWRPDVGSLKFGRGTVIANRENHVFVGTNVSNEILEFDQLKLVRRIRMNTAPRLVTDEDKKSEADYASAALDALPIPVSDKEGLKSNIRDWRFAETFPFYDRFYAGDDGTLWVAEPKISSEPTRAFIVHDKDGRALARVVFPAKVIPIQFGLKELLVVRKDDNDVPHVMVWRTSLPSGK